MDTWIWAAIANGLVAVAYLAISWLILGGLVRGRQLGSNRLGLATGLIFLTSAVHYACNTALLVLPSIGVDSGAAQAARDAVPWPLAVWDFATAAAAIYYLSLRSSYGSVLRGAQMFEDFRIRERQALELNDNIVQGLATAKYALEAGADQASRRAIEETLVKARAIITELLGPEGSDIELGPGELRRERPASAV
jgi:hypothetical protein